MPQLGFGELVVILMLTVLVFGAVRLPKIGADLGKMARNFKRGLNADERIQVAETKQVSEKASEPVSDPSPAVGQPAQKS